MSEAGRLLIQPWVRVIGVVLLFFGLYLGYTTFKNNQYTYLQVNTNKTHLFGEILPSKPFNQQINIDSDFGKLRGMVIQLASYDRINTSALSIKIYDESGGIIMVENIDARTIRDNMDFRIDLPRQRTRIIKKLNLNLTSQDAISGNALSVWLDATNKVGVTLLYERSMRQIYFLYALSVFMVALAILSLFYRIKKEHFFILVFGIFGMMFIIVTPIGGVADESAHFSRAYSITKGVLVNDQKSTIAKAGTIPMFNERGSGQAFLEKLNLLKTKNTVEQNLGNASFMNTAVYSPVNYIPQVLGMFLAKSIYPSKIVFAYLARLFNLLFFLVSALLALRLITAGRIFFLNIILLPMVIFQASSLSADAINFGLSFLFIAILVRYLAIEKMVALRGMLYLLMIAVALALCKQTLLVLILLLLILPNSLFHGLRLKIFYFIIVFVISCLAYWFWMHLLDVNGITKYFFESVAQSQHTYSMPKLAILAEAHHPLNFAMVLIKTINLFFLNWCKQAVGVFGWLNIEAVRQMYNLSIITLLISLSMVRLNLTIKQRLISALVMLAFSLLTIFTLYIAWTPINSPVIEGVQGRYFIPILPIFILFAGNRYLIKYERQIEALIRISIIICLYLALMATFLFYY